VVVEEAGDGYCLFAVGCALGVDGGDAVVDLAGGARDCFEHGVAAEGVEVGAGEGEGELAGDSWEGEGGGEGESGRGVSGLLWVEYGRQRKLTFLSAPGGSLLACRVCR
jgi:hypothetical protein